MIPLHAPDIGPQEQAALQACMESGWISSAAPQVSTLEQHISEATGAPAVVAVQSGTAALHLALLAAGIQAGDEVLVPDLTFIATANAVSYLGATPVLVDVDPHTWQMDLELATDYLQKSGSRVKAILLVHVLGYAADSEAWKSLADHYGITLLEDAAGAIGTTLRGKHVGTFGEAGILSFNGNKLVTTGGGGAVLCKTETMASRIRHLANQAKTPGIGYDHDMIGYNYRMNGMGAALGLAQLGRLPDMLVKHQEIHLHYREWLPQGVFPQPIPGSMPNYWLTTARLPRAAFLLEVFRQNGLQVRPFWKPIHLQKPYLACRYLSSDDNSSSLYQESISFPSGSGLTDVDLQTIREVIASAS